MCLWMRNETETPNTNEDQIYRLPEHWEQEDRLMHGEGRLEGEPG